MSIAARKKSAECGAKQGAVVVVRAPCAADGLDVHGLIAGCPPLDQNSLYCNMLQCSHFGATCALAERDGQVLGFVSGYRLPDEPDALFIWQIAVAPATRGLGLGMRMILDILGRPASIAHFLLGDDVYIHQSRLNFKPAFRGKEFYWHSDFETWHSEDGMPRMRALSMSIVLTPNHPFNGPLMLIPGSHRHYIACAGETPDDHYKQSLKKQQYGVPDDDSLRALAEEGGIETPMGAAGTVILFDCNTMHGSNSNITPFARSNFFLVYNALDNRLMVPFGGALA